MCCCCLCGGRGSRGARPATQTNSCSSINKLIDWFSSFRSVVGCHRPKREKTNHATETYREKHLISKLKRKTREMITFMIHCCCCCCCCGLQGRDAPTRRAPKGTSTLVSHPWSRWLWAPPPPGGLDYLFYLYFLCQK